MSFVSCRSVVSLSSHLVTLYSYFCLFLLIVYLFVINLSFVVILSLCCYYVSL